MADRVDGAARGAGPGWAARGGGSRPLSACRSTALRRPAPGGGTVRRPALVVATVLVFGGVLVGPGPRPAAAQELPEEVTREAVQQGERLFGGDGFCHTCHGPDGGGIPNLAPDLSDGAWIHVDGSLEELTAVVREGVPAERSTTGIPMPPRGGASLSPEQVRAVAAYVWTLSRDGAGDGP